MPRKLLDLNGKRFGKLVVLERIGESRLMRCRCDCGSEHIVTSGNLPVTKSCGCHRHGGTGTSEHHTWKSMLARCRNPNSRCYHTYGGKGITVCKRWEESFAAFLEDMGPRPKGFTLDRIDSSGNYEPGNCRWATPTEQARNTCKTVRVGEIALIDACEAFGVSYKVVYSRVRRGQAAEAVIAKMLGG